MKKSSIHAGGHMGVFCPHCKANIYANIFRKTSVYLLASHIFLLLIGCVPCPPCPPAPPPEKVIVREYVPVPAPEPQIPPRPVLPSSQLTKAPTIQELVKALLADRELLTAWALDLESRLKAYQSETKEKK
ncbi:MAG: hypothetical protein LBB40_03245 [Holophagales bacterium]|jgi:hypothetical protein|nr:hypothetical protein [Holophagales bacterium]